MNPRPVYVARHGETASNLIGLYAGRSHEPLTEFGRSQVCQLGQALVGEGVGVIWTSSIGRAVESARLLADQLLVDVVVEPRLDEMQLGPWEGRTEEEIARDFPEAYAMWLTQPDQVRLEGRETLAQVASRIMAVVAEAQAGPCPVLLMTHVAPVRVAVLSTLRYPLAAYKRLTVPNASCVRLEYAHRDATWVPQGDSLRAELERAGSVAA